MGMAHIVSIEAPITYSVYTKKLVQSRMISPIAPKSGVKWLTALQLSTHADALACRAGGLDGGGSADGGEDGPEGACSAALAKNMALRVNARNGRKRRRRNRFSVSPTVKFKVNEAVPPIPFPSLD